MRVSATDAGSRTRSVSPFHQCGVGMANTSSELIQNFPVDPGAFAPGGRLSEGGIFMQVKNGLFWSCSCQSSSFTSFCVDFMSKKSLFWVKYSCCRRFTIQGMSFAFICFCFYDCLAIPFLMSGWARPASTCSFWVLVSFRYPVTRHHLWLEAGFNFFEGHNLSQTGHAYFIAQKH